MSAYLKKPGKLQKLPATCFTQRGFSLMEMMVALSILAIGILATMQMGLLARYQITSGNIVTRAVLLGQSEVEKLRQYPVVRVREVVGEGVARQGPYTVRFHFSDPLAGHWFDADKYNCETGSLDGSGSCVASVTVSWSRGGTGRGKNGSVNFRTLLYGGKA